MTNDISKRLIEYKNFLNEEIRNIQSIEDEFGVYVEKKIGDNHRLEEIQYIEKKFYKLFPELKKQIKK